MSLNDFITLIGIMMAAGWTPGPNNALLASSGATFGYSKTVPLILGIAIGFPLMMFCVSIGLGEVFQQLPILHEVLRWAGAALLMWIAWKIATSGVPGQKDVRRKPFTFLQAAAFQWVNPKGWVMCISVTSQFMTGVNTLLEAGLCTLATVFAAASSANGWAYFGHSMQGFLSSPRRALIFNLVMAGIIILGVFLLITGDII